MIAGIEDYFTKGCGRCPRFETDDCSVQAWKAGLETLRQICLSAGLSETVKWGQPCYMHAGRNIAVLGAFRQNFRLGFFNPALMQDPASLLQKQGPNTKHNSSFIFTSNNAPDEQRDVIDAYLKEAMRYADQGLIQPKQHTEIDLPEEFIEAMDTDPEMAEAFHDLTKGRQRSYAIVLNNAKKSQTRISRIAKLRPKILVGKGANEY